MGASGGAGSDGHCPFPDSDGWLRRGISWCAQKRRENIWGVTGQQVGHLLSGIQGKKVLLLQCNFSMIQSRLFENKHLF